MPGRWKFGFGFMVGAFVGSLAMGGYLDSHEAPPAPARPAPRTVCASVAPHGAGELDADPAGDALRLRWCEARLAEKTRVAPTLRQPWPEDLQGPDDPEAWTRAMDAALATCAPTLTSELTDCEEVPCVVALRPAQGADAEAAAASLNGCLEGALPDAFGGAAGAVVVRARCPDGTEESVVMVTAATEAALGTLEAGPDDPFFEAILAWGMALGRRSESALQLWECGG